MLRATISCMVSILIHVFCVTQIPGTVSIYNKLFVSKNSIASLSLVSNKYINLISGKYFDEISQNTSKFCFGVDDTFRALEMCAVETLIVWENFDVNRYVLRNHTTNGKSQKQTTLNQNKLVLPGKTELPQACDDEARSLRNRLVSIILKNDNICSIPTTRNTTPPNRRIKTNITIFPVFRYKNYCISLYF